MKQNNCAMIKNLNKIFLLFLLLSNTNSYSATLDTCLLRTYGGPGNEFAYSMAAMSDSGIVLAGVTNYYGSGGNSVYMVRTDKTGIRKWSKVLGGSAIDQCNSVQVTGDSGVFLIGFTNSVGQGGYDGMIIKTDTAGNQLWEKSYGGTDWDFFNGGYLLPDGSIIACGNTYSNGAAQSDAFAVCIDQDGNVLWQFSTGGQFDDALNDVYVLGNELFFVGYTQMNSGSEKSGLVVKTDLSGNIISQTQLIPPGTGELKAITGYNGDLILVGSNLNPDSTHTVPWYLRIDTSLNTVWEHFFTNEKESYFNDVIAVSTNELVYIGQNVGGGFGGKTMLMIRTDASGNWEAGHNFGGASDEEGYSLINLPGNKLAGCGYTTSWGFGNEDALLFILPYDQLAMDYYYDPVYFFENLSPISVGETVKTVCTVSPNPAHSTITLSGIDMSQVNSITLTPVGGKAGTEMLKRKTSGGMDVSGLSPGMYFYRIFTSSATYNGKIVIQ